MCDILGVDFLISTVSLRFIQVVACVCSSFLQLGKKSIVIYNSNFKTVLPIVLTELRTEIIKENREANKRK